MVNAVHIQNRLHLTSWGQSCSIFAHTWRPNGVAEWSPLGAEVSHQLVAQNRFQSRTQYSRFHLRSRPEAEISYPHWYIRVDENVLVTLISDLRLDSSAGSFVNSLQSWFQFLIFLKKFSVHWGPLHSPHNLETHMEERLISFGGQNNRFWDGELHW